MLVCVLCFVNSGRSFVMCYSSRKHQEMEVEARVLGWAWMMLRSKYGVLLFVPQFLLCILREWTSIFCWIGLHFVSGKDGIVACSYCYSHMICAEPDLVIFETLYNRLPSWQICWEDACGGEIWEGKWGLEENLRCVCKLIDKPITLP